MDQFETLDNQIIALYRKGTPEAIAAGSRHRPGSVGRHRRQMLGTADHMATVADGASKKADAAAADARTFSSELILLVGLVALALGAILMWLITRSISRPLRKTVAALNRVAEGDLTVRLDLTSKDEVGQVAARAQQLARTDGGHDARDPRVSVTLASSSEELSATSAQLGSPSEETSAQANSAAATPSRSRRTCPAVATSSEEMAASIREIAASPTRPPWSPPKR